MAIAAVQLLGRAHRPSVVTGSVKVETDNVIDIAELAPMLHQPLDLQLDSLSVVSIGSRRNEHGDFPKVADSFIGTPPYCGRRETWLILRLRALDNTQALGCRVSLGSAIVASAQRIAATLRWQGIRAKVATAADITELDRRLGISALDSSRQRWNTLRGDHGWLTTYAYPGDQIRSEVLAQAWALRADEVIQNVTVYPERSCTATITVRTPQPLPAPPMVMLRPLPGEQARAAASAMCGPRPRLRRMPRSPLPSKLTVDIGPSGTLVGKLANGDRLLQPVTDPAQPTRVLIAADDLIAKRLVIRTAAAGERVCVHTKATGRWASVRMPEVALVTDGRPVPGTTVSVIEGVPRLQTKSDGSTGSGDSADSDKTTENSQASTEMVIDLALSPSPRPATVITVVPAGTTVSTPSDYDVVFEQVGRNMISVSTPVAAPEKVWMVEMDLFRAENRYVNDDLMAMPIAN